MTAYRARTVPPEKPTDLGARVKPRHVAQARAGRGGTATPYTAALASAPRVGISGAALLAAKGPVVLGIGLQIALDCPHCVTPMAVDALVPAVHCPSCRRSLALPAELWSKVLGEVVEGATRLREGAPDVVVASTAAGDVNVVFERKTPTCGICDHPIDVDAALRQATTTQGWAQCARCHGWLAFRPPPIAIRANVVAIACERFAASAEADPSKATQPLSFSCHQCGAVLSVDGTSRMVTCQYCRASVVLPDALWKTVRPSGKAAYWYLLCR